MWIVEDVRAIEPNLFAYQHLLLAGSELKPFTSGSKRAFTVIFGTDSTLQESSYAGIHRASHGPSRNFGKFDRCLNLA